MESLQQTQVVPPSFDLHKVYVRVPGGFVEYTAGTNFSSGIRECKDCHGSMTREPVDQPYIKADGGKILVDIQQTDGRMILCRNEPDYHWVCSGCTNIIPMYVRKRRDEFTPE